MATLSEVKQDNQGEGITMKVLSLLVTIYLVSQYGCVRRLENRMDKWAFFVMDHIWVFAIIFGIIAVAVTVLKGLSEKTCPDCLNKSVPKQEKYTKNVAIGSPVKTIG